MRGDDKGFSGLRRLPLTGILKKMPAPDRPMAGAFARAGFEVRFGVDAMLASL